ncbi:MAG: DUF3800 domain-containing protein [Rhabdochlamydiaceae bacterium]|jgi:hypothetical protein
MSSNFSEYIIFVDESGDHGMTSINPENPVFVLAFCIIKKADYCSIVKRMITKLKLDFWGHDLAILHSHDIRRSKGDFAFLFNEEKRSVFLNALHETIKTIPFYIVATAIDKRLHKNNESNPRNPYLLALGFCLDCALRFLETDNQLKYLTHIIVESRGQVEDQELEAAFRKISDQAGERYPFDIKFASKKINSIGLQIADLVAHPIAKHVTNGKPNKAFEVVREKLFGYPEYDEIGLKVYPLENEVPQQQLRQDADRELPIHL